MPLPPYDKPCPYHPTGNWPVPLNFTITDLFEALKTDAFTLRGATVGISASHWREDYEQLFVGVLFLTTAEGVTSLYGYPISIDPELDYEITSMTDLVQGLLILESAALVLSRGPMAMMFAGSEFVNQGRLMAAFQAASGVRGPVGICYKDLDANTVDRIIDLEEFGFDIEPPVADDEGEAA